MSSDPRILEVANPPRHALRRPTRGRPGERSQHLQHPPTPSCLSRWHTSDPVRRVRLVDGEERPAEVTEVLGGVREVQDHRIDRPTFSLSSLSTPAPASLTAIQRWARSMPTAQLRRQRARPGRIALQPGHVTGLELRRGPDGRTAGRGPRAPGCSHRHRRPSAAAAAPFGTPLPGRFRSRARTSAQVFPSASRGQGHLGSPRKVPPAIRGRPPRRSAWQVDSEPRGPDSLRRPRRRPRRSCLHRPGDGDRIAGPGGQRLSRHPVLEPWYPFFSSSRRLEGLAPILLTRSRTSN